LRFFSRVKFGLIYYTIGPFSHDKFDHDRGRDGYGNPQLENLVKIAVLTVFGGFSWSAIYIDQVEIWQGVEYQFMGAV